MGRLENFVISPKNLRIGTSENGDGWVSVDGEAPVAVDKKTLPFLKAINGHSTLKEIFSFLNTKQIRPGIDRCLKTVNKLAKMDFFQNADDFIRTLNARGSQINNRLSTAKGELRASYFTHARIVGTIRRSTLFSSKDNGLAEKLYKFGSLKKVEERERLLRKGTQSPYFYVVLSGELGVYRLGKQLATLESRTVFGESAAFSNKSRNADVVANRSSWVFEINAKKIMDKNNGDSQELIEKIQSRLLLNQTLAANPLFKSLPSDVLQLFVSKCQLEKHPKERVIVEQDSSLKQKFYFICSGSVMVIKNGAPVTSLLAGEYFGEVSALFLTKRIASIISETDIMLLSLGSNDLYEILCNHFELGRQIEQTAEQRMKSNTNIFTEEESLLNSVSSLIRLNNRRVV